MNNARPNSQAAAFNADDAELSAYVRRSQRHGLETLSSLGAFSRQMERYPQLSAPDQARLVARYQRVRLAGDPRSEHQAKQLLEQIIGSNFRLVLLICREQASRRYPSRDGIAEVLADLVSEGNAALVEAARKFNPDRSPNFPTYAARAVRDRVRSVLSQHAPLHMPASKTRIQRIARYVIPELAEQLGRPATREELQNALLEKCMEWAEKHLTLEQAQLPDGQRRKVMLAKLRKQGMLGAIKEIDDIMTMSQSMSSLDAQLGDNGSASLSEIVGSDDSGFGTIELDQLREKLLCALAEFDDRERAIILHRHGFIDGETWTFGRIAEQFGVTAERIRQIEKSVLVRLAETGVGESWR